jgi:CDP-diacylglycerol--glycerol-3-phosphate 3-phosphatidyltransferase
VCFIVAIATDGIDGYLARKYEIVTDLGKLLDPIADKALTGCAFVGLSLLGELPGRSRSWSSSARSASRCIASSSRAVTVAAADGQAEDRRAGGRALLALLPLWNVVGEWVHVVNTVTMWIAVVLTASGVDYVVTEIRGPEPPRRHRDGHASMSASSRRGAHDEHRMPRETTSRAPWSPRVVAASRSASSPDSPTSAGALRRPSR